ncbi:MAG TPA: uroporphyrinogen-III C-methyltransferase [Vicinamibacterales bacterium]|nr:uroporphyrinogen-III C-methyltransferase [Vicinamibacterales bacterium]
MTRRGFVSLVGAGPGHPDHLTVKAVRCLEEAEVVLHDALVSDEVCAIAAKALRINVGKRAGRAQTPQAEIERLLIEAAQQGLKVVRLKGGDPFVFGRGGEEALALQRAGIAYEVVPGVTSAVGAPTLAGIPVTHRGLSPGFVVLTGSDVESVDRVLASLAPGSLTVVVLMGIGVRATVAERMMARGWTADTPAAIVRGAATSDMWTWRGSLSTLASVDLPEASTPGTIIVGAVTAVPIEISNQKGEAHVRA